jgi:hypothetical protein
MGSWPLRVLTVIFVAGAGVVWVAGIQLATATDILDDRLHLGSALDGLLILAVATNLPEIAITVSAALSGNLDVAVGNILGGIALSDRRIGDLEFFRQTGARSTTADLPRRIADARLGRHHRGGRADCRHRRQPTTCRSRTVPANTGCRPHCHLVDPRTVAGATSREASPLA